MKRKRMSRTVYRGLREIRAYVNAALESAEFPESEQDYEQAIAAQEWLDDFLDALGRKYDASDSSIVIERENSAAKEENQESKTREE